MKWALLGLLIISVGAYAVPTQKGNGLRFVEAAMAALCAILAYWLYWESGLF